MRHLSTLIAVILMITGCINNTQSKAVNDSTVAANNSPDTTSTSDSVKPIALGDGTHCFAYAKDKDTISMKLILKDSLATGHLIYNLYEKDKNKGTFKGLLRNDTLLANYTFLSEGTRSVRQVVFLIKGNILLQGSGSMKEQNGRLVFSHKSDISFDGNTILEPMDCDSLSFK